MHIHIVRTRTFCVHFPKLLLVSFAFLWSPCSSSASNDTSTLPQQTNKTSVSSGPNIVVTVDSADAQATGKFQQVDGYLSRSRKVLQSDGEPGSVVFSPAFAQAGFYRVYVWWPQAAPTSAVAAIVVRHTKGVTQTTINQQTLGGQWNSVGIFEFGISPAPKVEVNSSSGAPVLVDAVRFEFMGTQPPVLAFDSGPPPIADKDVAYMSQISAIGGTAPYTWLLTKGQLPPGFILAPKTGLISGKTGYPGHYPFSIKIRDAGNQVLEAAFSIDVLDAVDSPAVNSPAANTSQPDVTQSSSRLQAQAINSSPSAASSSLTNLLDIVANMPEGQWKMVSQNHFSDVWTPDNLRPVYGWSNPPPAKIIQAWSSFAWDSNRGDLILFGGGHANYPGNDVYRWHGSTMMWERASLPSEVTQDDLGNWIALDGPDKAPISAHTYDNNIFLPVIDRLVVFGGAAFNNGGAFLRAVTPTTSRSTGPYFFDPAKADGNKVGGTTGSQVQRTGPNSIVGGNMWVNRDIYVNIPNNPPLPGAFVNGCTAYAQENGRDVVYFGARPPGGGTGLNLYKYTVTDINTPSLDALQTAGIYWVGSASQTACSYDATKKVILRIGSNNAPFSYWDITTAGLSNIDVQATPSDPSGEFPTLLLNQSVQIAQCGLDTDPIRHQFALWCGDGRVWMIQAAATPLSANGWTITKQPVPTSSVPNGDTGTGILGKWKYIPNLDVFMGLQDANQGNIWIYKPVGWTNPAANVNLPPLVSITQPVNNASFTTGTPVTITASASDADGTIALVEFYQGSTKIGQVSSTPFTFTWTNAPVATLTLTTVATDNKGAQTVSGPINMTVLPGPSGTVMLQDGTYATIRQRILISTVIFRRITSDH